MQPSEIQEQSGHPTYKENAPDEPYNGVTDHLDPATGMLRGRAERVRETIAPGPSCVPTGPRSRIAL